MKAFFAGLLAAARARLARDAASVALRLAPYAFFLVVVAPQFVRDGAWPRVLLVATVLATAIETAALMGKLPDVEPSAPGTGTSK